MMYMYKHSFLISAHEQIGTSDIYVGFEGQICCWHVHGHSMLLESWNLLIFFT